jgi:hypothetical protein
LLRPLPPLKRLQRRLSPSPSALVAVGIERATLALALFVTHQPHRRRVRYVALLLQHTRTTFSKMEYLEIFLSGKDVSQEVSKLQGCFSQSI